MGSLSHFDFVDQHQYIEVVFHGQTIYFTSVIPLYAKTDKEAYTRWLTHWKEEIIFELLKGWEPVVQDGLPPTISSMTDMDWQRIRSDKFDFEQRMRVKREGS